MPKVYNQRKRLESKPLDAVYVGRGRGVARYPVRKVSK